MQKFLLVLLRYQTICSYWIIKTLSCCRGVSNLAVYYWIVMKWLCHFHYCIIIQIYNIKLVVFKLLSEYIYLIWMPTLILLEYFIDNKCLYPSSVNFSCKQANLIKMLEKSGFFALSNRHFNKIFIFTTKFLVKKPWHIADKVYLLFPYYIVVSNLEADISLIESWFDCV